jgi:hypothetical protein
MGGELMPQMEMLPTMPSLLPPELDRLSARRALEALRAGVPNRDVARLLPPTQIRAIEAFETLLRQTTPVADAERKTAATARQANGILVGGGFGAGKSHLLEYFEHMALEENFICSRVVLSKETPLCDLLKLFRACVAAAVAPDRKGPALSEIAATFQPERVPGYRDFYQWAHRDKELDPRLPATLFLFENEGVADEELREKLLAEWMGFPMKVSELKAGLKTHGELGSYVLGRPFKDQTHRRFEFLTRFFRAAGYAGWVILLDETELVSKYSLRQRGKSYAYLARLLGQVKGAGVPGLASVFTITDDYAGEVLRRINDIVKVPARMAQSGDPMIEDAEKGMNLIEMRTIPLLAPSREQIGHTYERVRDLYRVAYDWDPPAIESILEYAGSTRMRQYIRAWITTWDLRRLYAYEAQTEVAEVAVSYEEDPDLQNAAEQAQATESEEEGNDSIAVRRKAVWHVSD